MRTTIFGTRNYWTVAAVAAVVLAASASAALADIQYTVTDLGIGGSTAINNSGQVVGQNIDGHACIWSNGTMTDLNVRGRAYAINDAGQVAGEISNSGVDAHAFLYSNGIMTDLGTLGGSRSRAIGINNLGQVVGQAAASDGVSEDAFLYSNGTMTDLGPTFGGTFRGAVTTANGINDSGQIIGSNTAGYACLLSNGTVTDISGGMQSAALAINSTGQVTGEIFTKSYLNHAFLYSNGAMADLGAVPGYYSSGLALNDSGQVVGNSDGACLYSNGTVIDLNSLIVSSSGLFLSTANGINDSGQIICDGIDAEGQQHVFLLNPIPEPATMGLVAAGLAALAARRRGKNGK